MSAGFATISRATMAADCVPDRVAKSVETTVQNMTSANLGVPRTLDVETPRKCGAGPSTQSVKSRLLGICGHHWKVVR
jgi:hypothetical protein